MRHWFLIAWKDHSLCPLLQPIREYKVKVLRFPHYRQHASKERPTRTIELVQGLEQVLF